VTCAHRLAIYFVCKAMASELMWEVVDRCVQLLGGRGFLDTSIVGQYFRDFRLIRIFEGATEVVTGYLGAWVLTGRQTFVDMLATEFGDGPTLRALAAALEFLPTGRSRADVRRHVEANVAGELACRGTLALAASRAAAEGEEADAAAARWCERAFQERVRIAGSRVIELPTAASLTDEVAGYEAVVGAFGQDLPGEARELDALLR
jgi:Acyl-CoA dehydrogenase, C-terminal domain